MSQPEAGIPADARCHLCHDQGEVFFMELYWCRDCYHAQGQSCSPWRPAKNTKPTKNSEDPSTIC